MNSTTSTPNHSQARLQRICTLILPVLVAVACLWMAKPKDVSTPTVRTTTLQLESVEPNNVSIKSAGDAMLTSLPASSPKLITRPIEDIRPGLRVLASNPDNSDDTDRLALENELDWRLVSYRMVKADGSLLHINQLEPAADMSDMVAQVQVELSYPELAIEGPAEVVNIQACPVIEPGDGEVVTATFHHTAANVINLHISGEPEPIGTTSNHPFWSEDRSDWVQAGDLRHGERLRLIDKASTTITDITRNPETQSVYNLTVNALHTYHVGDSGVLVHNSNKYLVRFGKGPETLESLSSQAAAAKATGRFPHGVSTNLSNRPAHGPHRGALLRDVEEHFTVHPTPTDRYPLHQTVELPNPVTQSVVDLFNSLFGG